MTLAEVVAEVGVPATTLRSWERRYGWPEPTRSTGGHRRYTIDHVRQIRALRDEISRGFSPRDAVPLLRSLERSRQGPYLDALRSAAAAGDPAGVVAVLDHARRSLDVRDVVEGIVFPTMRELASDGDEEDRRRTAGRGVRSWLTARLEERSGGPLAVLACAPQGETPLDAAAVGVLVTSLGWSCRIAETNFSDLGQLVEQEMPEVLVLWCARVQDRPDAVHALRDLRHIGNRLFFCGDAFATARSRRAIPGVYLGAACLEAARRIHRANPR